MENCKAARRTRKSCINLTSIGTCSKVGRCSTLNYLQPTESKILIKTKRGLSASSIRRPTISDPNKYHNSILTKIFSDIPSGLDTFKILATIKSKDSHFHIPVPTSIVINCGFEKIMLIDSDKNLKIQEAFEITNAINYVKRFYPHIPDTQAFDYPLVICKYRENKLLEFSMNSLVCNFPSLKSDLIIQKFIMPKGLRITKYRVIINEFKKVLIFSNKNRTDGRLDTKANFGNKNQNLSKELIRTVILHKDVKNAIKSGSDYKDVINNKEFDEEKMKFINIFHKTDYTSEPTIIQSNCSPSIRFLTSNHQNLTSLFEGKNQSYAEIIQMTEHLWAKIDYYYLDNSKLSELACDFLQDKDGNWFFLKIKYGKTELKEVYKTMKSSKSRKTRIIWKDL